MKLTPQQMAAAIAAGTHAGRQALENYSHFDSSMVPDDALKTFCVAVITAALGTLPTPPTPQGHPNATS